MKYKNLTGFHALQFSTTDLSQTCSGTYEIGIFFSLPFPLG